MFDNFDAKYPKNHPYGIFFYYCFNLRNHCDFCVEPIVFTEFSSKIVAFEPLHNFVLKQTVYLAYLLK